MEKLNALKRKSKLLLVMLRGTEYLLRLVSYPALDLTAKLLMDDTAKMRCRKIITAAPLPCSLALLNLLLT